MAVVYEDWTKCQIRPRSGTDFGEIIWFYASQTEPLYTGWTVSGLMRGGRKAARRSQSMKHNPWE